MHRHTRSEAGDISSPRSSRAPSFSSDRPSVAGSVTFQMPSTVRPEPAYIAASVASQIVTDHHNAQLREDFDSDSEDPAAFLVNALFSEQALCLLNAFLDHLLFAFLSTARSPSLTSIRPAITEVLKPRLAREAMATADEELQGLLAGEDDEEFPATETDKESERWDVEKVWKRTRLRIMVYTRLGELEDEDEERYVQQERGLSMDEGDEDEAGLVSWASAIFLTSVIEYVAEQTLVVSGQAAFARMSAKMKRMAQKSKEGQDQALERIIVEDFDVEKLALNSALGRLWRTWRKRVRSPIIPLNPARGPRSIASLTSLHRRRISYDTLEDSMVGADGVPEVPEHKPTETEIAANIPLPVSDNDVEEIEVPGLARQLDEESSGTQTPVARPQRPASFIMLAPAENFRRTLSKERPSSMPPPTPQAFTVPAEPQADEADLESSTDAEADFATPMERASDDDSSYIVDERQENMHYEELGDDSAEADADMVAFAASTGMGFGMSPISPSKSATFDKEEDDTIDTPTQGVYDQVPRVLKSKRMSIEKSGPPEVVRTYSTRSSRSSLQHNEGKSYLDDPVSDEDLNNDQAIGVARTSNIPVRVTPSPPIEAPTNEKFADHAKQAQRGVYDPSAARHYRAAAGPARKTPNLEDGPAQPERTIVRKEMTPPKPRAPVLASLQEVEPSASGQQYTTVTDKRKRDTQRGVPSRGSPRHSSSTRSRESPVALPELPSMRKSVESSPRSRSGTNDGFPVGKAALQRVSSSSSAGKSVGSSILNGRDSETSIGRPRGLSRRMSEEDREREFDTLVRNEETVKYTLTPQSMRDMDEPPVVRKVTPHSTTSSVTVYPVVKADKENSFGSQPMPARSTSRSKNLTSLPSHQSSVRKSGPRPLAREPRIDSESMRDFADFIRSTGPQGGSDRQVQPFVSLSNSDHKAASSSSGAISGLSRKLSTKQGTSQTQLSSGGAEGPSAKLRIHMEPRSAATQRTGNDDLIDFIRQGPPGANNEHRIPRTVAPFRSTVDSDQFERMLDENGNVESGYGSQVSTTSKQSTHTSNSRTGLLPATNVVQPAYSNNPQKLSGSMSNSEPYIQRTRRRVKDPYAIDYSDDEEDDLLTALPKSATRQEESMMDFLSSMEPPATSDEPKPFILSNGAIAAAKARAASSGSAPSNPSIASPAASMSNKNGATSRGPPGKSSLDHPGYYPPANSAPGGAPRQKLQARTAGVRDARTGGVSATNDLADFLRTSGPPEPTRPPPGASARKEEGKRINARFWRKKTYPDMP